jgi:mono/diheme cytochrome c family protein
MGCVTCHGFEGRGGVQNYNYIKKTVPAHDRTAAKIFLENEEDRNMFMALIRTGLDPNGLQEPPDISRYRLVMSRFNAAVELIRNGKNAARLNLAGPEPPLQMPAWKDKLNRRQIHAVMAYFISLFSDDEDEQTEG